MIWLRVGLCSRANVAPGAGGAALALLLLLGINAFAQEDYYLKLEQSALDEANAGNYSGSLEKARELYAAHQDNVNAYLIAAYDMINLGRYKDANGYIQGSHAIDPSNFSGHVNAAYYYALDGNIEMAKAHLTESIKLYVANYPLKDVLDDIRLVGTNTNKAVVFNQLADWYQVEYTRIKQRDPTLSAMINEFRENPSKIRAIADDYVARYTKLNWPEMALSAYGYACLWLRDTGYPSEGLNAAEAGFNYFRKNGYGRNPYQATMMLNELIKTYYDLGNDEKVIDFADEILELSKELPIHVHDVNAMILMASSYDALGNNDEARNLALTAYRLAEKHVYRFGAASAANSLCASYNFRRFDSDVNDAIYFGEKALEIAQKYKFELLVGTVMSNLGIAYYKLGTVDAQSKAIRLYGSLAAIYEQKEMWSAAANVQNTTGVMMYNARGYEYAAEYFEKSIAYAKKSMGVMSADDKLSYYQSTMAAYEFLAACYAHLDKPEKVYEAIEGSRSRVLTERLAKGKDISPGTIADLQKILQPDEAAIFYDLFSAHEVIILVVTKKYAKTLFHSDVTFIGNIKDKYLERLTKEHGERKGQDRDEEPPSRETRVVMADFEKVTQLTRKFFERPGVGDEILKEYLQGYYKFLILPILNRLSGVKNLLISPDDVLNYIPFEALQTHNGKYLVETYGVRYLNSTGALRLIEQRQYQSTRKPLIAMGGAIYEPNNAVAPVINTQRDLNALVAEVEENKANGASQRRPYAALFGNTAMNPLPGTLEEVKSISKNVPNSEIYSGRDFTENRLKSMSASGALKQYKVLHLATHGFVVEEIPDLSGIAMSVFTKEEGGEDGFLNVNEIAALNLNTDLAVLSACQTALGKIYSGEGVTGLTQSLLVAGSNAALVSLWPVNDTSTMLFMSDLYKEAAKGKNYARVVAELKRRFIKGEFGEEFRHPNFWAPFVYFGK